MVCRRTRYADLYGRRNAREISGADAMTPLKTVDHLLEVQMNSMKGMENDDYTRGVCNGMEMIRSVIAKEEPVFMNKNGQLDQAAADRHPERYI